MIGLLLMLRSSRTELCSVEELAVDDDYEEEDYSMTPEEQGRFCGLTCHHR